MRLWSLPPRVRRSSVRKGPDAKTGVTRGTGRGGLLIGAAQAALDGWEQDEVHTELDGGHVFLVANLADEVFRVDVPPGIYETGSGDVWRKRDGVRLRPENLMVDRVEGPIPDEDFRYRYAEEGDPEPF